MGEICCAAIADIWSADITHESSPMLSLQSRESMRRESRRGRGKLDDIFRYAAAHALFVRGGPKNHEKRNKS